MKKYLPIIIGVLTAILSALLIYFRKYLGNVEIAKYIAQIGLPLLLGIILASFPGNARQKVFGLTMGLFAFFIVLTFAEPFAFQYWVTQTTPAGSVYSRYDLDAMYPWFGWIFCGLGWAIGMFVGVSQARIALRKQIPMLKSV